MQRRAIVAHSRTISESFPLFATLLSLPSLKSLLSLPSLKSLPPRRDLANLETPIPCPPPPTSAVSLPS